MGNKYVIWDIYAAIMKNFFVSLLIFFVVGSAFAAGENVPTSKSYVDNEVLVKQNKILANSGAAQVLTNTGNAGEYRTKNIYDSSASYGGQSDALIDAQTMNTAIQNAIDSEFKCVDNDCTLLDVKGSGVPKSPNLFDISKVATGQNSGAKIVNNGDGSIVVTSITNGAITTGKKLSVLAPEMVAGETYTLSFDTTGNNSILLYCSGHTSDNTTWQRNRSKLITENLLNCTVYFYASGVGTSATISNIQIEHGSTATPYQPYGNIYTPTSQQ